MSSKSKKNIEGQAALDLAAQPSTYVLDVRTELEFRTGALDRAVLIPVDELERRIDELPESKTVVILVYCAHGVRSLYAQDVLERHGYGQVTNLAGGIVGLAHSVNSKT